MSTTLPSHAAGSRDAVPSCPTCNAALRAEGESPLRYWSCRACNLVYLA